MSRDLGEMSKYFLKLQTEGVTLDKVLLSDTNKEIILEIIKEANRREELRSFNLKFINTLLLWGIAGTGKTYVTKALSNELGWDMYTMDVGEVLKGNEALSNIKKVFEFVTDPTNQPCILFMDECDGLVKSREDDSVSDDKKTATNLILQRVNEENENLKSNLIIVSATNLMEGLDDAFKTRFQAQLQFETPNDYMPYVEMFIKKRKVNGKQKFNLVMDLEPNDLDIIGRRANEKNFSPRELELKIIGTCKKRVFEAIESGEYTSKDIQKDNVVLDLPVSAIYRDICQHIKFNYFKFRKDYKGSVKKGE